jgi:hypothetical protein
MNENEQQNLPIRIERCRITRNSLEMDENSTYEEWREVGEKLKECSGSLQWLIGDWVNIGKAKHEHRYADALKLLCGVNEEGESEAHGYDPNTIYRWGRVAAQFKVRQRSLSWSHHYILCDSFLTDAKREELLKSATDGNWTYQQLKDEIRDATKDSRAGVMHSVKAGAVELFTSITSWFNRKGEISKWPVTQLKTVKSDFEQKLLPKYHEITEELQRRPQ